MKYANYTASKKTKFVTIADNSAGRDGIRIEVSGMKEARQVAAQHNAKPWNF